ncbi:MAG: hypothetical protein J2P26_03075 [Nocardiopsaceae bacterium]|nr:hypothetical protein [Nocardiopsaceae bacterium]
MSGAAADELALGISAGLEPRATFADDTATGVVVTRSSSWWNRTLCKTCGHTFRRGDRALVDSAARTVVHLVPGLACGTGLDRGTGPSGTDPAGPTAAAPPGATGDRDEFTEGLLATWPANVALARIAAGDWRVPRPGGRKTVPACLYCGHTFRPGEYVVICPCQPGQPACETAVHRDPAAGLPCWDRWRPAGKLSVCPTTTARL